MKLQLKENSYTKVGMPSTCSKLKELNGCVAQGFTQECWIGFLVTGFLVTVTITEDDAEQFVCFVDVHAIQETIDQFGKLNLENNKEGR